MFSVCIPVYNAEAYLEECILSVLRQTYQSFEMVLVDDGSKDDSYRICQKYAALDKRIKCFTKKNEGQLATRLFAFSRAHGNFVVCLDSDDYLDTNALEILNCYFTKYSCDCIYFGWRRFRGERVLSSNQICDKIESYEDASLKYKKIFGNSNFNSMCLKAFRFNLLPQEDYSRFYELRMAEDLIQTVEIVKQSAKILLIPDIIYNYRVNPSSVTENSCVKNCDIDDVSRQFVLSFLKKENVFSEDDWSVYGTYCNDLFFNELMKISNFPISIRQRLLLLNKKRNTSYYKDFIQYYHPCKRSRRLCLYFFKKNFLLGVILLSVLLKIQLFFKNKSC